MPRLTRRPRSATLSSAISPRSKRPRRNSTLHNNNNNNNNNNNSNNSNTTNTNTTTAYPSTTALQSMTPSSSTPTPPFLSSSSSLSTTLTSSSSNTPPFTPSSSSSSSSFSSSLSASPFKFNKHLSASCSSNSSSCVIQPPKHIHILQLPADALRLIIIHLMQAPQDNNRPVSTPSTFRNSLPFAHTCHTIYKLWASCLQHIDVSLFSSFSDVDLNCLLHVSSHAPLHRFSARKCQLLSPRAISKAMTILSLNLKHLDLSHTKIDDSAIICLFSSSSTSQLSSLALHDCKNLSMVSLHTIAKAKPPLKFLDLGFLSHAVNDTSLTILLRSIGSTLKTLIISSCIKLTDRSLVTISITCTSLISLTMRSLPLITDAGMRTLCIQSGFRFIILDVLDCKGLTLGGYLSTIRFFCPHIYRHIDFSFQCQNQNQQYQRSLRDCIIATMPGLIYRISATDAIRRLPALYFLLLDESALRPFRIAVQGRSLNLSDFGSVLVSNFGKKPTRQTRAILRNRFGHDSTFDSDSDDESCRTSSIISAEIPALASEPP